jgi:hypothetical protein
MNVYIEPLIGKLLNLWVGITMYDICKPIGEKKFQFRGILVWTIHDAKPIGEKKFQFRGILVWTIHDALGLTNFCGM